MILLISLLLPVLVYLYLKWHFSYWKRRGVHQLEPHLLYGDFREFALGKKSAGDISKDFYEIFESKNLKYGGLYQLFKVMIMPTDLNIIKSILLKDFQSFMNRGVYVNEEVDPLTGHLFSLEDEKWKNLRLKLTPTFTTGKVKMMFPTMVACANDLNKVLKECSQDSVNIKDVIARFTTDVIGSTAFGIDCNSLKNPDSEFRKFGKRIFTTDARKRIKRMISVSFSKSILQRIGFKLMDKKLEDFFIGIVRETLNYREKNDIHRKDFMHLLLQLKNKGEIRDDHDFTPTKNKHLENNHLLTLNEVAAQCFVFFIAGFETSSTTMTFALLELAINSHIQEKLRTEINTVMNKYGGELTYEAVMEMNYLDKVVHETLRKHPPLPATSRKCNATYKIEGTDVVIEKGVRVIIPVLGIQMNPKYYPEPERFDPERFNEETKASRPHYTFLPFGEGPRTCIGARFGLLQTKVGLIKIIKNFQVSLNNKTKIPIKYAIESVILAVDGDVWLNLHPIE